MKDAPGNNTDQEREAGASSGSRSHLVPRVAVSCKSVGWSAEVLRNFRRLFDRTARSIVEGTALKPAPSLLRAKPVAGQS